MGKNFSKDDFNKGKKDTIKTDPKKGTTNNLDDLQALFDGTYVDPNPEDDKDKDPAPIDPWSEEAKNKNIKINEIARQKNAKIARDGEKKIDTFIAKDKKEALKRNLEAKNKPGDELIEVDLKNRDAIKIKIGTELAFGRNKYSVSNAVVENGEVLIKAVNKNNTRDVIVFTEKEFLFGYNSKKLKLLSAEDLVKAPPEQPDRVPAYKKQIDAFYKNMPKENPELVWKYIDFWDKKLAEKGEVPEWFAKFKKEQTSTVPKGEFGAGQVRYMVNEKLGRLAKLGMGAKELAELKDEKGNKRILGNSEGDRIIFLGDRIDEAEAKIKKDKAILYALEEKLDKLQKEDTEIRAHQKAIKIKMRADKSASRTEDAIMAKINALGSKLDAKLDAQEIKYLGKRIDRPEETKTENASEAPAETPVVETPKAPDKLAYQLFLINSKKKDIEKSEAKISELQTEFEAKTGKKKPSTLGNEPVFRPRYTAEEIMEQISDEVDEKADKLQRETMAKIDALDTKTTRKLDRKEEPAPTPESGPSNENEDAQEESNSTEKREEDENQVEEKNKKEKKEISIAEKLTGDIKKELDLMLGKEHIKTAKPKILECKLVKIGEALKVNIVIQVRVAWANLNLDLGFVPKFQNGKLIIPELEIDGGNYLDTKILRATAGKDVAQFTQKMRDLFTEKFSDESKLGEMLAQIEKDEKAKAKLNKNKDEEAEPKKDKKMKKLTKRIKELEELIKNKLSGE